MKTQTSMPAMQMTYICPVCNEKITASIESSGFMRYDWNECHEALNNAIGDHMQAMHDKKKLSLWTRIKKILLKGKLI